MNYLVNGFIAYLRDIARSRRLILELTRREFRARHLGSAFGLLWAFIQPAVMLLIYWGIFSGPMYTPPAPGQPPFLVSLLSGLVPWFILSDCMMGGTSVILENRFLVKKVVFRISLLPVVRLISHLPVHLFFVIALTLIFWSYGYPPSWYSLQLIYFLFALLVLGLGWSLLISALVPFLRDLAQIVSVVLQVLFWAHTTRLAGGKYPQPGSERTPFSQSFFLHRAGLPRFDGESHARVEHPFATVYYWIFTGALLTLGAVVFARLQSHFADVL